MWRFMLEATSIDDVGALWGHKVQLDAAPPPIPPAR
jgi:hypothetical protein